MHHLKKRMLLILRENAQVHYGVLSTYHSNYDINAKVDQFIWVGNSDLLSLSLFLNLADKIVKDVVKEI